MHVQAYELAHTSIEQFIKNTHEEWFDTIDSSIARELGNNLLIQDQANGGLLCMNFHKDLLAMSQEVHYWERMRMNIPYIAMEINAQREKYRILRENVLIVVREYNSVGLSSGSRCERSNHFMISIVDSCSV